MSQSKEFVVSLWRSRGVHRTARVKPGDHAEEAEMRKTTWCAVAGGLLLAFGTTIRAADIWWTDGNVNTGTCTSATWSNLQFAVNSAQGDVGSRGKVKISGDITRLSTNEGGQLAIWTNEVATPGDIEISGGWEWNAGSEPVTQSGQSTLDVNSGGGGLGDAARVIYVKDAPDVTVDSLIITGSGTAGSPYVGYGAGVSVVGASHRFIIVNAVVSNNLASSGGAGLLIDSENSSEYMEDVRVSNCVIITNRIPGVSINTGEGGGIWMRYVGVTDHPTIIENCEISYNLASRKYGGAGTGGGSTLIRAIQWY